LGLPESAQAPAPASSRRPGKPLLLMYTFLITQVFGQRRH
jgi:hypothetical protein